MYSFNRALNFKILVIRDIFAARDNKWDVYKRWTVLGAQWPVQWFKSRTIRMIEVILNVLYKSHSRRAERSSFEIIRWFLFFCCFFFAACYWGRSGKSFWGRLKTCGIKILKARKTEIWSRSKREANRSRSRRSPVHSGGVDQCFQTFPAEMWKKGNTRRHAAAARPYHRYPLSLSEMSAPRRVYEFYGWTREPSAQTTQARRSLCFQTRPRRPKTHTS